MTLPHHHYLILFISFTSSICHFFIFKMTDRESICIQQVETKRSGSDILPALRRRFSKLSLVWFLHISFLLHITFVSFCCWLSELLTSNGHILVQLATSFTKYSNSSSDIFLQVKPKANKQVYIVWKVLPNICVWGVMEKGPFWAWSIC